MPPSEVCQAVPARRLTLAVGLLRARVLLDNPLDDRRLGFGVQRGRPLEFLSFPSHATFLAFPSHLKLSTYLSIVTHEVPGLPMAPKVLTYLSHKVPDFPITPKVPSFPITAKVHDFSLSVPGFPTTPKVMTSPLHLRHDSQHTLYAFVLVMGGITGRVYEFIHASAKVPGKQPPC